MVMRRTIFIPLRMAAGLLLACAALLPAQAEDSRNGLVVTSPNGYANLSAQDLALRSTAGPVRWTRSWNGQEWKFNPQWESLSQSWSNLTGSQTQDSSGSLASGNSDASGVVLDTPAPGSAGSISMGSSGVVSMEGTHCASGTPFPMLRSRPMKDGFDADQFLALSNQPECGEQGDRAAMSPHLSLPADLPSVRPATLCLVDADYPQVLALCETLWAGAGRDGWIAYRELPCLLDTAAVDMRNDSGRLEFFECDMHRDLAQKLELIGEPNA